VGKIENQIGVFRRLELDPDEFIRLVPQAQDEMIAKTIAAGVIPGQISKDISKANRINRQLVNILNDMDYLNPPNYGQGYYAMDDDMKMHRLGKK
jgi:hypothetical protein